MNRRADLVLVQRGFFESRNKARAAIEAGLASVDGVVILKPADLVNPDGKIEAVAPHPWVSRAGLKLEAGLELFHIDPRGKTCLDIGASTGGFTQVLLTRGAARVYAVDVGREQLHPSLREDTRVVSMETCDARSLDAAMFEAPLDLIVCDASFISLKLALPKPLELAAPGADLIALIKPQFEAGRERVGKGGIVRDPDVHYDVCVDIRGFLGASGWRVLGLEPSPISGSDGNREFLIAARKNAL